MILPKTTPTVLLVDDAPDSLQILSSLLHRQGLDIVVAQSGREALDRVAKHVPDLILLDVFMPDIDGFEVCKRLKHDPRTQGIPVIFLIGRTARQERVKGLELGAADYLMKPFEPTEVLARVSVQLELKHARDLLAAQNQDLTEQNRKLMEFSVLKEQHLSHSRQESERLYKTLVEAIPYGIQEIDLHGKITYANSVYHTFYGYENGELIGTSVFDRATSEEEGKKWRDYMEYVVREEPELETCMGKGRARDGKTLELQAAWNYKRDTQGHLTGFILVITDITERKRAENAVRTSEQQYRHLAEEVPDGIGILQEGVFVFVNQALAAILGYPVDQLLKSLPVELLGTDWAEQSGMLNDAFVQERSDSLNWPILQHIITGDGREIWVEGRRNAIVWEGTPALLMVLRDITKRKLREIAVEEERDDLRRENIQLKAVMQERCKFGEILGKSRPMQTVYELIMKAAASGQDVLIYGESGTGKELVAHTIHQQSSRRTQPFIPVNCGAIPETLFEREFFGHHKGAFTGADRAKKGLFEAAHQGTLFLDEVGELTPIGQVKLLRVLESGEYLPLGSSAPKKADVRVIAATHRNLAEQVEKGTIREDFYYRIHVIIISIPPLRERKEDIALLVDCFLKQFAEGAAQPVLSGRVLDALLNYDWPGNIRQLQNVLRRYLTLGHLDFSGPRGPESTMRTDVAEPDRSQPRLTLHEEIERLEKHVILTTLDQHHWHRTRTAQHLGIPRSTLRRKMEKFGLI